MRRDSRLSRVLHILLHIKEQNGPVTSEALAKMLDTNPVVIRQIMAGLRKKGYVQSEKGHGGGWTLASDMSKVTLYNIYIALDSPPLFAIGNNTETPVCLVEQTVNTALEQAFHDAEKLLLSRLRKVTLATLNTDFQTRLKARGRSRNHLKHAHAS